MRSQDAALQSMKQSPSALFQCGHANSSRSMVKLLASASRYDFISRRLKGQRSSMHRGPKYHDTSVVYGSVIRILVYRGPNTDF